jgi:hypothetical protein
MRFYLIGCIAKQTKVQNLTVNQIIMTKNPKQIAHPEFAFKRGYMQVQQKDVATVRKKIMSALNITTRATWLSRLNGKVEPKITEVAAISGIFADYGITDIWGV